MLGIKASQKWWIYGDLMVFVGKNGDFMGFNHYKWWIYGDLMVMIMVIYVGKNDDFDGMDTTINGGSMVIYPAW
jgi:hypothetical protein